MWRYYILNLLWNLVVVLLSPLIMWQGYRTRRDTIRLPEAPGPRAGLAGASDQPKLQIVFLGDSTIAGVGAKSMEKALAGQLIRLLANEYQVDYLIKGTNGHRIKDVILSAQNLKQVPFDYIIIEVGVNDVTKLTSIYQWQQSLKTLTDLLKHRFPAANIIYNGLPPVYLFTALPQPLRMIAGFRTYLFDSILARHCKRHRVAYAPIVFSTDIDNLAEDGYHPSEKAYAIWAEGLYREFIFKY